MRKEEFLKLLSNSDIDYQTKGKIVILLCPLCKDKSVTIIPVVEKLNCLKCNKKWLNYEEFLKELNISVENNRLKELFDFYERLNWDLVPIKFNTKEPEEWWRAEQIHKDRKEWEEWAKKGYNFAVKLGKASGNMAIEVDKKELLNEIEPLAGNTLTQFTRRGKHYFYLYDKDLSNYHSKDGLEVRGDGLYILIEPAVSDGIAKKMNLRELIPPPQKLKDYIESKKKITVNGNNIEENIQKELFKVPLMKEGDGRHLLLFYYGCYLRKTTTLETVKTALSVLNKMINTPLLGEFEIDNIIDSIRKYNISDVTILKEKMLLYLGLVKECRKGELEFYLSNLRKLGSKDKENIAMAINELIIENKIVKVKTILKIKESFKWDDTIEDINQPVEFRVPYFDDIAYFNKSDAILIGAMTGSGKSILAMNMVKLFVEQGIKPIYIYSEPGGRWSKNAKMLGLKNGDFWRIYFNDPVSINFPDDVVIIWDWISMAGQWEKSDELWEKVIMPQLEKTKSFLIAFTQDRDDGKFLANNLVSQQVALSAHYVIENETGEEAYFEIKKVRDSKGRIREFKIPMLFDWSTFIVKRKE